MALAFQSVEPARPLILVVEDDPIIALDLEETLQQEGYYVLGPAPSVPDALALLQHADPDAAVLDVSLQGKKVTPVAQVLADHEVPFLLTSGDTEPFAEDVLATARNLGKPTDKVALLDELDRLLRK